MSNDQYDWIKPEVYKNVYSLYPKLFKEGYVIELTHEGWSRIIQNMCFLINAELEHMPEEIAIGISATQIKSKFGGLRFYMSASTPYINGIIELAERLSLTTCEICGETATGKKVGGWYSTLCEKHHEEEEASWILRSEAITESGANK